VRRVYAAHILTWWCGTRQSIISESATQVRGIAASVAKRVTSLVSH
jgi:hypothetical protein